MEAQTNRKTILVAESDFEVRAYLEVALKCSGYSVELAQDADDLTSILASSRPVISAVLLAFTLPPEGGMPVLEELRRSHPGLPVIILSAVASTSDVVAAMKAGAFDFLGMPVAHKDLGMAVDRAVESLGSGAARVARPSCTPGEKRVFFSASPRMREIYALADDIGSSEVPVLIQGETGTGKEVLARELHARSARADNRFLKLNCAALPSELVESELFGYERGAFTGAFQKKVGMFEAAEGGTIFLDEIGDMDVRLQAKLLQVLQDHEFQRIGGKELIKADVRVLAATHRDLETAISDRAFREDLYYRLNVVTLYLPPLRDRREDILPLAEHLLHRHAEAGRAIPRITENLAQVLMSHNWPGNVRELENTMRRLIVLRDPDFIARELSARAVRSSPVVPVSAVVPHEPVVDPIGQSSDAPILEQVSKVKEQAEANAILAALHSTRWHRKRAAMLLKIDYKALLYKMKKLGIENQPVAPLPPPNGTAFRPGASVVPGSSSLGQNQPRHTHVG
ncbi:MAG: sigma-54-dependent Fis family transcriptional regulator [Acidobacteriia bacterium]|nr:sigma-54-dependent Fis family transcriptional regulator [Terriglobia bacterium]